MAQRSGSTCPQAVATAIEPALAGLGLDLYDVELVGGGRARTLRVFVHRDGGVDLETIAQATQAVSALLDTPAVAAALPGPYTLEVSSPGLERPLRTPAHFRSAWAARSPSRRVATTGNPSGAASASTPPTRTGSPSTSTARSSRSRTTRCSGHERCSSGVRRSARAPVGDGGPAGVTVKQWRGVELR